MIVRVDASGPHDSEGSTVKEILIQASSRSCVLSASQRSVTMPGQGPESPGVAR